MNYNKSCCLGASNRTAYQNSAFSGGCPSSRTTEQNCTARQGSSWQRRNFTNCSESAWQRRSACGCGENGISPAASPRCSCSNRNLMEPQSASCPCKNSVDEQSASPCSFRREAEPGSTCGSVSSKRSLAMVYAPNQCFTDLYDPRQGLCNGTVFSELNKPFLAYGRKSR